MRLAARLGALSLALYVVTFLLQLYLAPSAHVATPSEQHADRRVQLLAGEDSGSAAAAAAWRDEAHRPLKMNARTVVALLASLLVSALANSAGVGGGAFFVPLFNVVTGFSVKMSTALSQAVIAGGAVGSTAYALSRRHPLDRKRPLVDFELTLLLTPVLLLGVSTGVLLNVVFPTWAITLCLVVLLCYLTARTARTGLRLHAMEKRMLGVQRSLGSPKPRLERAAVGSGGGRAAGPQGAVAGALAGRGQGRRSDPAVGEGEEGGLLAEGSPLLGSRLRSTVGPAAAAAEAAEARSALQRGSGAGAVASTSAARPVPIASSPSGGRAASLLAGLGITGHPWQGREGGSLEERGTAKGPSFEEDFVGSLGSSSGRPSSLIQRELSMQRMPSAALQGSGRLSGVGGEAPAPDGGSGGGSGREGQRLLDVESPPPLRRRSSEAGREAGVGSVRGTLRWGESQLHRQQQQQQQQEEEEADVVVHVTPRPFHLPAIKLRPTPFGMSALGPGSSGEQATPEPHGGPSPPTRSPSPRGAGEQHGMLSGKEAFQAGIHGGEVAQGQLDERRFPWVSLAQLLALWGAFLAFQLAKSQLLRCSWGYAAIYAGQAAGALAATGVFAQQLLRRERHQHERAAWGEGGDLERPILGSAGSTPSPEMHRYGSQQRRQQQPQGQQGPQSQPQPQPQSPAPLEAQHAGSRSVGPTGCATPPAAAARVAGTAGGASGSGGGGGAAGAREAWSVRRLAWVLGVVLGGGAVAGLLGIGGGMIVGPLMLELGVHPQVSSATSGVMVLFSASVAAASFAARGRLNLPYAALFGAACLASAFLGVLVVGRLVKRSGRASLIVLLLAGIMGLGAVLTAGYAGSHAVSDLIHGRDVGFSSLCVH